MYIREDAKTGFISWDLIEDRIWGDAVVAELLHVSLSRLNGGLGINEFMKIVHPEDREYLALESHRAISSGKSWEVTYRVIGSDQIMEKVSVTGAFLRFKDGYPTLSIGAMRRYSAQIAVVK